MMYVVIYDVCSNMIDVVSYWAGEGARHTDIRVCNSAVCVVIYCM